MSKSLEVFSEKESPQEVINDILSQIDAAGKSPKLIVFFAANAQNFTFYAEQIKKAYPETTSIGSTSYCNMNSKGFCKNGASALVVFSGIECSGGLIFSIDRHPLMYVEHIKKAMNGISSLENTCCLEFCTAFTNGEELVMDTFNSVLKDTDIPVVGGSAGRNDDEVNSLVAFDGVVYQKTCAFVFIHNLNGKIKYCRENIYKPTSLCLEATDVDCDDRVVYEYDYKPAADVLAQALNVELEDLPELLPKHPTGRIAGENIYIAEANKINEDGSISYFSRVYNHQKTVLLELDDIDTVWKSTMKEIHKSVPKPSFSIVINCLSRTKLFEKENRIQDFKKILSNNVGPFVTLSGYGEQMDYVHLNQSLVLLVFE